MTQTATVMRGVGGHYRISRPREGFAGEAMVRGVLRLSDKRPLPGDHVEYTDSGDPDIPYVIERILPRRNDLLRPPMANLDQLLITVTASRPQPDFFLIDRLLVLCAVKSIEPLIILTKLDIEKSPEMTARIRANYEPTGYPMIETGFDDEDSLDLILERIKGCTVAFAGQSGVGKSTLLNRLTGTEKMDTAGLSERIGRGRHTTRRVELFPFHEGFIADTPGFSMINLAEFDLEPSDLVYGYPELQAIAEHCRFRTCRHDGDLGCAVASARIHPERLERYRTLLREIEQQGRRK